MKALVIDKSQHKGIEYNNVISIIDDVGIIEQGKYSPVFILVLHSGETATFHKNEYCYHYLSTDK